MDLDDNRPADRGGKWTAGLRTGIHRGDTNWVDGHLEEWWDHLLWTQFVHQDRIVSWWLRDGVPVPPISDGYPTLGRTVLIQPVARGRKQTDFALSYPTLAPYAPFPSASEYGYDPWAAQMFYSVWW